MGIGIVHDFLLLRRTILVPSAFRMMVIGCIGSSRSPNCPFTLMMPHGAVESGGCIDYNSIEDSH